MTYKTGSIGDFKQWTMTVAADPARAKEQPKQWFDTDKTAEASHATRLSPEAMVKLLSEDNLALLKLIGSQQFKSVSALAKSAQRKESNLSVTLRKFADAGIIALVPGGGKSLQPRLVAQRVTLDVDLMGMSSSVAVLQPVL